MKINKTITFWLLAVLFLAALLLAQQMLKQQGSGLIPGNGGDFTLQSVDGPVSLHDYRGKVVALYFGYMSCPDICPTSLWNLSSALQMLTPQQAEQVQSIFVSLDPERDSPLAMSLFVKGFGDRFVGLTADKPTLDKVARQYSVVYEKVPLKDSAMGYVLDHSSVIYLIDKQGVVQYFTPHGTAPEELRDDLVKLIEED